MDAGRTPTVEERIARPQAGRTTAMLRDVGYLLIQCAQALTQERNARRNDITLVDDGTLLLAELRAAVEDTHLELLRIYWYDGSRDRRPTAEQRLIGLHPRVKLRLGDIVG